LGAVARSPSKTPDSTIFGWWWWCTVYHPTTDEEQTRTRFLGVVAQGCHPNLQVRTIMMLFWAVANGLPGKPQNKEQIIL